MSPDFYVLPGVLRTDERAMAFPLPLSRAPSSPCLPNESGVERSSPDYKAFTKPSVPPSPALRMPAERLIRRWDQNELMGRREGKERGTEAGRRWRQGARMVMGRCTQAHFQLLLAHVTFCAHGTAHTAQHTPTSAHGTRRSHTAHTCGLSHPTFPHCLPQTHMLT